MVSTTLRPFTLASSRPPPTEEKTTLFHSLFRRGAKPNNNNNNNTRPASSLSGSTLPGTSRSSSPSSSSTTRIPAPSTTTARIPLFKKNPRVYTPRPAGFTSQTAFCLPSCPIEEEEEGNTPHGPGLFRHRGESTTSEALSFLLGAQNPPPDIWLAHAKLMHGVASEEEEELLLA
ncbi:MAG: hypothetical protein Q9207_000850, partial [Kuettlingeria erythrocarpa]